jgi:hypothetical protein
MLEVLQLVLTSILGILGVTFFLVMFVVRVGDLIISGPDRKITSSRITSGPQDEKKIKTVIVIAMILTVLILLFVSHPSINIFGLSDKGSK